MTHCNTEESSEFSVCWTQHEHSLRDHIGSLPVESINRHGARVRYEYPGDLMADTRLEAKRLWPDYAAKLAGNLSSKPGSTHRWLLGILVHQYVSQVHFRVETPYSVENFESFTARHRCSVEMEGNSTALERFARRLCRNDKAAAEDLVQDTFVRVAYNLHKFKDIGDVEAEQRWLFVIMRNIHLDIGRAKATAETGFNGPPKSLDNPNDVAAPYVPGPESEIMRLCHDQIIREIRSNPEEAWGSYQSRMRTLSELDVKRYLLHLDRYTNKEIVNEYGGNMASVDRSIHTVKDAIRRRLWE